METTHFSEIRPIMKYQRAHWAVITGSLTCPSPIHCFNGKNDQRSVEILVWRFKNTNYIYLYFRANGSELGNGSGNMNHSSVTNDNVTFGKRDYSTLGFSYLNDLDRSEVETTTEL